MADVFTKEKRSEVMSRIKGKDTKLEVKVRSKLFKKGFRFRKNDKRYPGKPDILLPKYRTSIFINGCFWHGHKGCKFFVVPKTRTEFWVNKINTNIRNDKKNHRLLKKMGWKVVVCWECQLKKDFVGWMGKIERKLTY
jgi:DNA mismatch endonuclease, patch repair protein